jgi:predicted MFS family arabinose efflux permease
LFLPQIRQEFALTVGTLGNIASAGYVGSLLALLVVNWRAAVWGPRWFVGTGGACAGIGMAIIGLASTPGVLLAGVFLTGMAPGLVWAPYSDAVAASVIRRAQGKCLSMISTGTTVGIMVAGPAAMLATGTRWHTIWLVAAVASLLTTAWNIIVLPGRPRPRADGEPTGLRGRPQSVRLCLVAFSLGIGGATYWTFAGDFVATGNHGDSPSAALLWTLIGVTGTAGMATGYFIKKRGLQVTCVACQIGLAFSFLTLVLAASNWVGAVCSAVLFGPSFMIAAALLSVWSLHIFPDQSARGFSFAIICLSLGSIAGPSVFGIIADHYGLASVFLGTSLLAFLTITARPATSHQESLVNDG